MNDINCPQCGTDDNLTGTRVGEMIRLTCTACNLSWDRDTQPHCDTCGSRDMVCVPELLIERSRGTQLSIMGVQPLYLCRKCDAEELAKPRGGHLPNVLGGQSLSDRR